MTSLFPASIQNSLNQACNTCSEYMKKAQELYEQAEKVVVDGIKSVLPEEVQGLAERVGRALPETVFSMAMFTGTFQPLALVYWAARVIWVTAPVIQSIFKGEIAPEAMTNASQASFARLEQQYEKFVPAIALSCAVGAVYCGVFGVLSRSPTLLMQGSFLATLSYLAYNNLVNGTPPQPQPQAAALTPNPVNIVKV